MIIKTIFYTYKKDFPLIKIQPDNSAPYPSNITQDEFGESLNKLHKNLILELAQFIKIPQYCYIARHTGIPPKDKPLNTFKNRFDYSNIHPESKDGILTVWFAIYTESEEFVNSIKTELENKEIEFWNSNNTYDSFELITEDDSYMSTVAEQRIKERKMFPKFLHQITQIGIDLLKNNSESILSQVPELEWRTLERTQNIDLNPKMVKLRSSLEKESRYYRAEIHRNKSERKVFWLNFKRFYEINGVLYSWPHFLFNICGKSNPP